MGWAGQGGLIGPVTLQKHLPVSPASKALHFTDENAKTLSNWKHHNRSFQPQNSKNPPLSLFATAREEG